jgi:hypothetical protein
VRLTNASRLDIYSVSTAMLRDMVVWFLRGHKLDYLGTHNFAFKNCSPWVIWAVLFTCINYLSYFILAMRQGPHCKEKLKLQFVTNLTAICEPIV